MEINRKVILRLSRYKNALYRLRNLGFVRVFSENLADAVGVTAAQVRKDFSLFAITGNKRGGYDIDQLLERLKEVLGKDAIQNIIVAGCGNLGSALMKYPGFEREGMRILAGFDGNPHRIDETDSIPVYPMDKMAEFIKSHGIRIGVIAVPDFAAQEVADAMIDAGIKGVINFAPIRVRVPEDVVINTVNLALELENVVYFVNAREKTGRE